MQKRTMNNESKTAVKAGRIEQACARYGLGKIQCARWQMKPEPKLRLENAI